MLASIINVNFGYEEVNEFCTSDGCALEVEIDFTAESSPGENDGTIMLNATAGVGPFQYSIDGGMTFQSSGTFNDLPAGDYDVVVLAEDECLFEDVVTVPACAIQVQAQVTNVSAAGTNDGVIVINASNTQPPVQYSIDGGATFVATNTFDNLAAGVLPSSGT